MGLLIDEGALERWLHLGLLDFWFPPAAHVLATLRGNQVLIHLLAVN